MRDRLVGAAWLAVSAAALGCAAPNPAFDPDGGSDTEALGDGSGGVVDSTSGEGSIGDGDGDDGLDGTVTGGDGVVDDGDATDDRSTDDEGGDTEDPAVKVRCPGVLWGANEGGELWLVDVLHESAMQWGELGEGTWAIASARTGHVIVSPLDDPGSLLVFDPLSMGPIATIEVDIDTNEPIARATYGLGRLWLGTDVSGMLWSIDPTVPGSATLVAQLGQVIDPGGDHEALEDVASLVVVGMQGTAAMVDVSVEPAGIVWAGVFPGRVHPLTGIAREGTGRTFGSTPFGTIFEVKMGNTPVDLVPLFETDHPLDDLAPVFALSSDCP